MELVLVRHGEAERQAPADAERRLTPRGEQEARATGQRLAGLDLPVPVVVSSTLVRARQTAELLAEALGAGAVRAVRGITPDDEPRRALLELAGLIVPGSTLVVVTHMPVIGGLIALLEDGDLRHPRGVATAGGAVLSGEFVQPGLMRVRVGL